MKTRLIVAAILVPVLFLVTLALPKFAAAVIFGLLLMLGVFEMLYRTGFVVHIRMNIYSALAAFGVAMWSYFDGTTAYLMLGLVLYLMLLFGEVMLDHVKVDITMVSLSLLSGFIMPLLLSSLIRILVGENGRYLIMLPFAIAFLSDSGAYLIGFKFGKHKLAPVVSPNKTIEGMFGGIIFAIAGAMLYALMLHLALHFRVNYLLALLYGVIGSFSGVMGDLTFSIIKRQAGIKDYGNIIPGHGGFLDKFDSMAFVAPVIEALLLILPMAV